MVVVDRSDVLRPLGTIVSIAKVGNSELFAVRTFVPGDFTGVELVVDGAGVHHVIYRKNATDICPLGS